MPSFIEHLPRISAIPGLQSALDGKETAGAAADLADTLGDLAFLNSLTKSDIGLSNVSNDAQLKISADLADLNSVSAARTNLGLGSLAVLNSVTKSLVSDLETITATPTANSIVLADANNKIDNGWLNTGSGNGLDADKLDSYEAAAFPKLATDNTFTGANQVGTSSSDRVKLTAPTTGVTPQVDSVITGGFNLSLRNAGTGGRAYYFCATHDLYGSGGGRLILLDNTTSTGSAALTLLSGKFGFGVGNIAPTAVIDSNGDTIRLRTSKTPASATATGNAGDICWDSSYVYICTATNTWKRAALSTW